MPIELGIWKMDKDFKKIHPKSLDYEEMLEELICKDISLISDDILLIGRQVITAYGKKIDLLGINSDGELIVIELKRDRTPRDVVAQVLDYGSWVDDLSYETIGDIYERYMDDEKEFEGAFEEFFNSTPPETLNESHHLYIVASEFDPSTERIVDYLSEGHGVPVNAIFFKCFEDGENKYLTRTWLKDPKRIDTASAISSIKKRKKEPWNHKDFYVNFGVNEYRNWKDARKYGFVSAGGGRWYSKTLSNLFPGARIFAYIPGEGYVGVGIVKEEVVMVKDFTVELNGKEIPILEAPLKAPLEEGDIEDPEKSEYIVRIDWIKTIPREKAYREKGMFATQHTVSKLRNKFTLEKLIEFFELEE